MWVFNPKMEDGLSMKWRESGWEKNGIFMTIRKNSNAKQLSFQNGNSVEDNAFGHQKIPAHYVLCREYLPYHNTILTFWAKLQKVLNTGSSTLIPEPLSCYQKYLE